MERFQSVVSLGIKSECACVLYSLAHHVIQYHCRTKWCSYCPSGAQYTGMDCVCSPDSNWCCNSQNDTEREKPFQLSYPYIVEEDHLCCPTVHWINFPANCAGTLDCFRCSSKQPKQLSSGNNCENPIMCFVYFLAESQQTLLLIAAFVLALVALLCIIGALIFLYVAIKCKFGALTSNQALPFNTQIHGGWEPGSRLIEL